MAKNKIDDLLKKNVQPDHEEIWMKSRKKYI